MTNTFEIVAETKPYTCSRCAYVTYNETQMRAHILDRTCSKNAQYYTGGGAR